MADACKTTKGAGSSHTRGFEDAVNSRISGKLIGIKIRTELFEYFDPIQQLRQICQKKLRSEQ